MGNFIRIFSGGVALTVMKLFSSLLVNKLVAVYSGPAGLAVFSQFQSVLNLVNGLCVNQISQGVTRFTAENSEEQDDVKKEWWSSALFLILINFLFTIVIFFVFIDEINEWLYDGNGNKKWIIFSSILLPFSSIGIFILAILNGLGKNKEYFSIGIASTIISAATSFVLINKFKIDGAIYSLLLSGVLQTILAVVLTRKIFFRLNFFSIKKIRKNKILSYSAYMLMGLVGAATGPVALITIRNHINEVLGTQAVGHWQSIFKLSDAYISIFAAGLSLYIFPIYAKTAEKRKFVEIYRSGILFLFPLASVAAFFYYFLRNDIILLLYSPDFLDSSYLIKYQIMGDVFRALSLIPALMFLAKGEIKKNIWLEIFTNLNFVLISFLLIDRIGLVGVVYAYVINYLIYFGVTSVTYFSIIRKY